MRKLFQTLEEVLKSGEDAVLATVVASSGSTPRGAGARMIVTAAGRLFGTIGGGAVEFRSEKLALDVLRARSSRMEHYILRENDVRDLGMVCGGDVRIFFRYISADDAGILAVTEKIEEMYRDIERSWLICEITPEGSGAIGVYGEKTGLIGIKLSKEAIGGILNNASRVVSDKREFYCERLVRAGFVYIFGGGHVAQAVVPALATVGFRCVVLEDREDFCRNELFHGVFGTRLINNDSVSDYVKITEDDYVVIMTRGHKDDQVVMAQALKTPACYIGVIGSKRKANTVLGRLRDAGFSDEELKRITTPIGLEIGAETPEEIAVSIAAQLISERSKETR